MSSDTGLLGVIQRLSQQVQTLAKGVPSAPVWATVTSLAPLRVRRDGYLEPDVDATDNAAGRLCLGDRVLTQQYRRRVVVIGPARPRTMLRFGTWNLYYAGGTDHPWASRRAGLAASVVASGVEVLAFQESDFPGLADDQWAQLVDSLNAASGSSGKWRAVTLGSRCGVAFDEARWVWTGVGGKASSAWAERNLVWLLMRSIQSGENAIVAADHWHPDNGVTRNAQAQATRAVLAGLADTYRCTVALGVDMNDYGATYGQPPNYMTAGGVFQRLKAFPGARRTEWPTWHDWKPNPPWTAAGQSQNEWLDDVFVARGQITAGGIYADTLPIATAAQSDHHLLTADIVVTNELPAVGGYDSGWTYITNFQNGFTAAAGEERPQIKLRNDDVEMRGVLSRASAPSADAIAFVIPDGMRPTPARAAADAQRYFHCVNYGASTWTSGAGIGIQPNGNVRFKYGSHQYVYLDAVRYGRT